MSNVPTNLIPTRITGLPEYTGSSTLGYLPYILDGRTYKVQFANIAAVGAVPSTREINTGTGLGGGGDLSANRTLYILPAGVDDSRLTLSGVTAGVYGSPNSVPVLTINAQGRVTAATSAPIVLSNYVPTSRTITAGAGLTGGGDLSANRSFAVNFSSTTPEPLGTGTPGVATVAARGDHVHPAVDLSDTTETQGVLPLSRGGTGNSLSPVVGAVAYSSNDKLYLTPTSGTAGQVLTSAGGTGAPYWQTLTGTGTVTEVSVVTANGFAGTVANPNTLPAITVETTVTGMIKGNGTAISAATAAVDYVAPGAITTSGLTMATARLLGRTTALSGAVEEITVGTGLSLSGGSLTNTAPDQIVSLTGAGTTVVTGTYPNFTITSNDQYVGTVTSVSGTGTVNGLTLTGTVTSSGSLTLGGTLSNVSLTSQVTGTLPIANGGTNATTAGGARTSLGAAASGANTDITSIALTTGTISATPTSGTDIVNKTYADSIASGINFHQSVRLATTAALPANTYNNGASGVGATLTANANGALTVDGVAAVAGNRILVKNEVTQANNGVYTVTQVGDGSTPYILTRATDFDSSGSGVDQIDAGDFFLVTAGSTQANTSWVQQTPLPIVVGTTALVFTQFAAPVLYSAGTGLTLAGTVFSITNTGVSASTYGSASQVPVIAVNAQGQITSASNSSIAIAGSQITSGSVAVAQGGTGTTTLTANGILLGNGASAISTTAVGATGQVLVGNTGAAPTWATLSSSAVTSFSAGTTGLTPSTATTGAITLAGTLNVANGGTGATTLSSGYLLKGNGTSAVSASVVYDDGTNVGIGTASPASKLDIGSGDLRFSSTGQRILGDFSSATFANRVAIQTTTVNSSTGVSIIPSASGFNAALNLETDPTFASGSVLQLVAVASSDARINSGIRGTGTYLPMTFYTNGSERMRLDTSGNLGIGTSSPTQKLEVNGQTVTGDVTVKGNGTEGGQVTLNNAANSAGVYAFDVDGSGHGRVFTVTNNTNLTLGQLSGTGGVFSVYTSAAERMRIDSSGNVGIGTTAPTKTLMVSSGGTSSPAQGGLAGVLIANTDLTASGTSGITGALTDPGGTGRHAATIAFGKDGTWTTGAAYPGNIQFWTRPNSTADQVERMRIDSSGNVGIGTTSPASLLHVKQSSDAIERYPSGTWAGRVINAADASAYNGLLVGNRWAASSSTVFEAGSIYGNGSLYWSSYYKIDGVGQHFWGYGPSGLEGMRLNTSGNVGIGTSAPGAKLDVNGSSATDIFHVTSGTTYFTVGVTNGTQVELNSFQSAVGAKLLSVQSAGGATNFGGNVGIGTSTPSTLLHALGSGSELRSQNTNTGQYFSGRVRLKGPAGTYRSTTLVHGNDNVGGTNTYFAIESGDSSDTYQSTIAYYNYANQYWQFNTSNTERMRISSGGYVAIGNSNAAPKFSVTLGTGFSWGGGWGAGSAVFGGNGAVSGAGSGGLAISYDDTDGGTIGTVIPGVAWKPLRLFSDNIQFCTNGATERMRITAGGNVGIGTSSVAGGRVQINGPTSDTDGTGLDQGQLLITDSDNSTTSGLMLGYRFNTGVTEYGRIQCRNAVGAINLVLQAGGGNVGIGTNAPNYKLDVVGGAISAFSNSNQVLLSTDGAIEISRASGDAYIDLKNSTGEDFDCRIQSLGTTTPALSFSVNGGERMRIDSSGNLLVGTSGPLGGNTSNEFKTTTAGLWPLTLNSNDRGLLMRQSNGSSGYYAYFEYNSGTNNGSISWSGGTTAYNTTSDARIKKNIVDAPDAGALIDGIKVRSWDFKADNVHWRYGMVAQELLDVAPEAVSVPEDPEMMMGVDYSKLVPMLVKELQSLRARVAELEGK